MIVNPLSNSVARYLSTTISRSVSRTVSRTYNNFCHNNWDNYPPCPKNQRMFFLGLISGMGIGVLLDKVTGKVICD